MIANQYEATPLLLEVLEDYRLNPDSYEADEGSCIYIVALVLLAHFREPAAWPIVLLMLHDFSNDYEVDPTYANLFYSIEDQFVPSIIASIAGKQTDDLKDIVLNSNIDYMVRADCIVALQACYFEGDIELNEFVTFLSSLFDVFQVVESDNEKLVLWTELLEVCISINQRELLTKMHDSIPDDLTSDVNFKHLFSLIDKHLKDEDSPLTPAELEQKRASLGYFKDAIENLKSWELNTVSEFSDEQIAMLTKGLEAEFGDDFLESISRPYIEGEVLPHVAHIKAEQKVGRNELCPCGSNKKFKKCCGK